MKKAGIPLFLLMLLQLSCSDCHPESERALIFEDKEIQVEYDSISERYFYTFQEGDRLIFEYRHVNRQCDHIMDDEWSESIKFQITDSSTKFRFINEEILTTNCHYQQSGAWVNFQLPISAGTIEGEKLTDDKWRVLIAVETSPANGKDSTMSFNIEKTFKTE